jgi:hypothetical protein
LVPPFDGGQNFVWILFPPEGSRVGVSLCQEAIDRGLKFNDRAKHAALEAPLGELGEKPSTAFSQEDGSVSTRAKTN